MGAKYSLAAIAVALLITGAFGRTHGAAIPGPQKRVLVVIGVVFGLVSAWLFYQS